MNQKSNTDYSHWIKLALYSLGIYVSFSQNALIMEALFLKKIKIFPFFQSFLIYACTFLIGFPLKRLCDKDGRWILPRRFSFISGVCVVASLYFTNLGFKNASFFFGNFVKSAKTVAIIIFAVFMRDWNYLKKLKLRNHIAVLLLTVGIITFFLFEEKKKADKKSEYWAIIALILSLAVDSVQNNQQRKAIDKYKPSSWELMCSISGYACVVSLVAAIANNEVLDIFNQWSENEEAQKYLLGTALTSASGQTFIYLVLNNFGPVKLSMITGSRKVLSILLSIIIFQHSFANVQLASIGLVILSLIIEFSEKKEEKVKEKEKTT